MKSPGDPQQPCKSIQVICPVYNEEQSLLYFYERLRAVRENITGNYQLDLTFVNNASVDRTAELIQQIRSSDPSVQVITHSRNFGYQASVLSGLTNLEGDAYIVIDADCEDPPELIPDFIRRWEEGYDLVYGDRKWRSENTAIATGRRIFYRLTSKIADSDFIIDMAEFSLFSRRMRDQVISHRSTFPFVRSDLAYAGFRRVGIQYRREPRRYGVTHYNILRMAAFALSGILSASTFPLRAIAYGGIPLVAVDVIAAVLQILGLAMPLPALALVNLAFVCFSLVSISLYVARISKDVIGRPVFIVDELRSEFNRRPPRVKEATDRVSEKT
jgi:polyisoprenyl-phosphate glycosyltransferase